MFSTKITESAQNVNIHHSQPEGKKKKKKKKKILKGHAWDQTVCILQNMPLAGKEF